MSKKLTSLYLPNSDKDALVIAGECLPAGKAVANPDNILRSALFEGKNHKIASVVRLHDPPFEFIKPQIIRKKAIISRRLCQILIPAIDEKKSPFLLRRILKKIEALRSKLRRIFDSYGIVSFGIRSLTPQQATGNALATEFNPGSTWPIIQDTCPVAARARQMV
jgi:hypothetical protein